ncbi:MAG: MBL fold metallo-hydrolase [Flavobacteriales bacterium]|nr:MBL fold metallo-hydrolase [Flavobacteriales bacterium]MCB9363452.1 MBL fold metallo-hydrolase [Flavobacteriales bacterium]
MYVKQLFTGCLAEMAYYIESNGEAAIIDPLRETTPYTDIAIRRGAKIKYVFLTHFHADFVSGHLDLAKQTGATIVFGPNATTEFEIHSGKDGEEFQIGEIKLKLLHTPGHTMESSSYLLIDAEGETPYVFTGDALFIGDVGRPDLAVKSDLTEADLAGHLFDSLRNKLMVLPDETIVYPAHGAGSACGKNMSKETYDTLGHQKETNYALRADMTKEEFIKEVTTGLVAPPQYFPKNVGMNKGVNKSYDNILKDANKPLSVAEFKQIRATENALIMDVRHHHNFIKEHVKGSLFFGLDGGFAPWVGTLIEDLNTPILLVVPEGREEEAITRLSRVGYDNVKGFLKGGIKAWEQAGEEVDALLNMTPQEFADSIKNHDVDILDVRKESEFYSEHIENDKVINSCLDRLMTGYKNLDKDAAYYVHCAGGYRSVIAISILKNLGFKGLVNIDEGFAGIKKCENIQTSEYVCPTTML